MDDARKPRFRPPPAAGLLAAALLLSAALFLPACRESDAAMRERVDQTAEAVNQALTQAKSQVVGLREKAERLFASEKAAQPAGRPNPETHRFFGSRGVYYKSRDDGGCGVWASGFTPVDDRILGEIALVENLEPDIKALVANDGLISQSYILSSDHFGVFYPYLDSAAIFPPGVDFYETYTPFYEAAPEKNPTQGEIWIEPYLDATGKGYMTSVSSPIHASDGRFLGAAGGDVEAASLKTRCLDPKRFQMILTRQALPLAATDSCVTLLGLHDFSKFVYLEGVDKDAYASGKYGLVNRDDLRELAGRLSAGAFFSWDWDGRTFRVYAAPIPQTGWILAELAEG